MTPNDIIRMIMSGKNPQQLMLKYLEEMTPGSPIGENLLKLAKEGKTAEIEQVARNICASQGVDYDKEFSAFTEKLGIK